LLWYLNHATNLVTFLKQKQSSVINKIHCKLCFNICGMNNRFSSLYITATDIYDTWWRMLLPVKLLEWAPRLLRRSGIADIDCGKLRLWATPWLFRG